MYKKIMLAIDGSEISHSLVKEIVKLTKNEDVHLRIIHVLDNSFVYYGGEDFDYLSFIDACRKEGQNILDKFEKEISSHSSIKVETFLLELEPFQKRVSEVIVEAAKEWPADLLVIGTHGRRGFSRLFLGSVADNITRISTTPILLIHGNH